MCDTIFAPPASTTGRVALFGKNSDRQRNEAQLLEYTPRADHPPGSSRPCTYITIAQAPCTYATWVSRPFWMWGAEIGANEHGVVIGNEALGTRGPHPEEPALTGMDLLRLTLERASSAAEAVSVLTMLLERHGQGGNCGHIIRAYYHNGYLIADSQEAFAVETVGRDWLVERPGSVRAISNIYSIERDTVRVSEGLHEVLRSFGGAPQAAVSYAQTLNNPAREHINYAGARRRRSTALLAAHEGQLRTTDMMRILRDHGSLDLSGGKWSPDTARALTVCMHAGTEERPSQTTASWVAELRPNAAVHWVTATAAPCISIFKPLFNDTPLPEHGPAPTDRFDRSTLWWRHERMHRSVLSRDFQAFIDEIQAERDTLEARFQARVKSVMAGGNSAERTQVIEQCWKEAAECEQRWFARVASHPRIARDSACEAAWSRLNELASVEGLV
jgi:secernin